MFGAYWRICVAGTPVICTVFIPKHCARQNSRARHESLCSSLWTPKRSRLLHPAKRAIPIATIPAANLTREPGVDDDGTIRFPGFRLAVSFCSGLRGFSRYHARLPAMKRVKSKATTDQARVDNQTANELKMVEKAATRISDHTSFDMPISYVSFVSSERQTVWRELS